MKSNELFTISGKRGYGKTTLAKSLIGQLTRVAIWDPMGEYQHPGRYIPEMGTLEEFNSWLSGIWQVGNCFILVDEADFVMPVKKPLIPFAYKVVNTGRHRNIGMGMITRRIAELNKTAFSQSEHVFLFRHSISNDIRYLAEFIEGVEEIRNLEKFQYKQYRL
ncbi:MAG TPA: hypothetical protein VLM43_16565 [Desulfobacterales bacterium]|nr:hypothetical protein [Desulfobacterales bacterium]